MLSSPKFQSPIILLDGRNISTVQEALDFYFALPMHERIEGRWTEAAKLLVSIYEENGEAFLEPAEAQFRYVLERRVAKTNERCGLNSLESAEGEWWTD
jgi:hypothetical protein